MPNSGTLQVRLPSEREILLTRVFDAPRELVFDAFTEPELLKRWFGPCGWALIVCERNRKTTLTSTIAYPSTEVRDIVIGTGMEHGAAETYDRLAELLASVNA